jgi:predicted nucleic acid-binding protein
MASTPMVKVVFDASGIWGFEDEKVGLLNDVISFFEKTNHKLIMSSENLYECPLRLRDALRASSIIEEVKTDEETLSKVKGICSGKFPIGKYDYNCITAAVKEDANLLISNDYRLIKAANECRNRGLGRFKVLNPVSLLTYMYNTRRDLFDWKPSIAGAVRFYYQIEISRMYHDITKLRIEEDAAKRMFAPYAQHFFDTLKTA